MKKTLRIALVTIFTVGLMAGCGSSGSEKEKDALKLAQIACEMRQMGMNLSEGDFEGLTKFTQKMNEFTQAAQEMETKYGFTEENEEFENLIREALKKTDCKDVNLDDLFNFFDVE